MPSSSSCSMLVLAPAGEQRRLSDSMEYHRSVSKESPRRSSKGSSRSPSKETPRSGVEAAGSAAMNPKDCLISGLRARIDFLQRALETAKPAAQEPATPKLPVAAQVAHLSEQLQNLQQTAADSEKRCRELKQALDEKSQAFEDLFRRHAELEVSVKKRVRLNAIAHWWPGDPEASEDDSGCAQRSPKGKNPLRTPEKASDGFRASDPWLLLDIIEGGNSPGLSRSLDLSPFADSPTVRRQRSRYDYYNSHCSAAFDDPEQSFPSDGEAAAQEAAEAKELEETRGRSKSRFKNRTPVRKMLRGFEEDDEDEKKKEALLRRELSPFSRRNIRRSAARTTMDEGEVFPPPTVAASQGYAAKWLDATEDYEVSPRRAGKAAKAPEMDAGAPSPKAAEKAAEVAEEVPKKAKQKAVYASGVAGSQSPEAPNATETEAEAEHQRSDRKRSTVELKRAYKTMNAIDAVDDANSQHDDEDVEQANRQENKQTGKRTGNKAPDNSAMGFFT